MHPIRGVRDYSCGYRVYRRELLDRAWAAWGEQLVVQRGFRAPPSYHEQRLRNAPAGYFFDVMTNGFGAMSDYAAQVPVADRWAISAYIRALQLSQRATVDDVPVDRRPELDQAPEVRLPPGRPETPPAPEAR